MILHLTHKTHSPYPATSHSQDREKFYTDPLDGDVICLGPDGTGCGTVVVDHEIFSGAEKRNFEGEADRNHFGPKPNKLLPGKTAPLTAANSALMPL